MTSLAQMTVPFHGAELFLVEHEGQPYTPMKPIVEGMGLDWAAQFTKLKQRFKSTIVEIAMVANDGKERLMTCLPVRKLFGWLMTISPNKIPNLNTRDTVIMYQNECDDVLWDYWTKGQAINQRKAISPEQKAQLQEIVHQRSLGNVKARQEMWARHNRHFNVASYHDLLAVHFHDACDYLSHMQLNTKPQAIPTISNLNDHSELGRMICIWWGEYAADLPRGEAYADAQLQQKIILKVESWGVSEILAAGGELYDQTRKFLSQVHNEIKRLGGVMPPVPEGDSQKLTQGFLLSILNSGMLTMRFDHKFQPTIHMQPVDTMFVNPKSEVSLREVIGQVSQPLLPTVIGLAANRIKR